RRRDRHARNGSSGASASGRSWTPARDGAVRLGGRGCALRIGVPTRACAQIGWTLRFTGHSMPKSERPLLGLSVFFPAYNDSGTIASLVIAARQAARELTSNFEIIIVNDGSADATAEIADELARTYPEVKVVHHERNRGYGGALRSGFAASTRD